MLSTKAYETRDATLLSFPKNVVITLGQKKGMDKGWLYGTFDGKTGMFPQDYVSPIIGTPTQTSIELAKRHVRTNPKRQPMC